VNNAVMQHVLAGASADTGPVAQLLRDLIAPGGAVEIADQAAWSVIRDECPSRHLEEPGVNSEVAWFRIHHAQLELEMSDDEDRAIAAAIARAVNYLARRELLVSHPQDATLVRLADTISTERWL
jgi:hypothetical protein